MLIEDSKIDDSDDLGGGKHGVGEEKRRIFSWGEADAAPDLSESRTSSVPKDQHERSLQHQRCQMSPPDTAQRGCLLASAA